jgi:hypothetical protein
MDFPAYDILKTDRSATIWIESAYTLDAARVRVERLATQSEAEYFIFDQRKGQIVATFPKRSSASAGS